MWTVRLSSPRAQTADVMNERTPGNNRWSCIPVDGWLALGAAQTLCDVLNMRDYGKLDTEER